MFKSTKYIIFFIRGISFGAETSKTMIRSVKTNIQTKCNKCMISLRKDIKKARFVFQSSCAHVLELLVVTRKKGTKLEGS